MKSETTMAKKSYMYQNKSPMSAKEKQLQKKRAAARARRRALLLRWASIGNKQHIFK